MERLFFHHRRWWGRVASRVGGAAGNGPRIGRWPSARLWVNAALSESVSGRSILLRMCPPAHFRARSHTRTIYMVQFAVAVVHSVRTYTRAHTHTHTRYAYYVFIYNILIQRTVSAHSLINNNIYATNRRNKPNLETLKITLK